MSSYTSGDAQTLFDHKHGPVGVLALAHLPQTQGRRVSGAQQGSHAQFFLL